MSTPNPAAKPQDHAPVARHVDDIEWETIRWPGENGRAAMKQGDAGFTKRS